VWMLAGGTKATGEFQNNQLHGCVKVEFSSGDLYWGQCVEGMVHGYGTHSRAGNV
jgi:hypothetical protein